MSLKSPRRAEPGPGEWTVVDLDSRLSVDTGELLFATGGTSWDRTSMLLQTPFSRRKAQYCEFQFTPTAATGEAAFAWNGEATADRRAWQAGLLFGSDGFVSAIDGSGTPVRTRYPYVGGTAYVIRLYDGGPFGFTATGGRGDFYAYIREETSANWQLLWRKRASPSYLTQIYATLNNRSAEGSISWCRIRPGRLPTQSSAVTAPIAFEVVPSGPDGLHEVTIPAPASGKAALTFRGTDSDNCWKLVMDVDNDRLDLVKRIAGVEVTIGSTAQTWVEEKPYVLSALTWDTCIRTFLGRTAKSYTTDAFNQTGDLVGVTDNAEYLHLRSDRGNTPLQW